MYTKKERECYNQHRANVCERLGITKNQYNYVRRIGNELHRLYEMDCNGELEGIAKQSYKPVYKKAEDYIISKLGLHVYYQTDPRGATIYLDKEPITQMNYTNTSCIY